MPLTCRGFLSEDEQRPGVLDFGGARMALLDLEPGFWGLRRQYGITCASAADRRRAAASWDQRRGLLRPRLRWPDALEDEKEWPDRLRGIRI
jgi:hypothetical protein